jgi:hypothetical protein
MFHNRQKFLNTLDKIEKKRNPQRTLKTIKLKMLQIMSGVYKNLQAAAFTVKVETGFGKRQGLNITFAKFIMKKHLQICSYGDFNGTFN